MNANNTKVMFGDYVLKAENKKEIADQIEAIINSAMKDRIKTICDIVSNFFPLFPHQFFSKPTFFFQEVNSISHLTNIGVLFESKPCGTCGITRIRDIRDRAVTIHICQWVRPSLQPGKPTEYNYACYHCPLDACVYRKKGQENITKKLDGIASDTLMKDYGKQEERAFQ